MIFRFLKMAAVAILDFQNFKLLTVRRLNRVEVRRHAKLGQNRSKCGGDMAIFRFFKMAAAAILDFQNFKLLTVGRLKRSTCVAVPNLVKIGQTAAEIWRFLNFPRWRPSAILDFVMRVFGPPTKSIWWSLSLCKIWLESMQ